MIFSRMDFSNETVPVTMFPNSTVAIRDVYQVPDFEFVIVVSISVLGLIGNLATILKIALDKKLHTPTFLAISSLAISDFIYLFTSIIYELHLFSSYVPFPCMYQLL